MDCPICRNEPMIVLELNEIEIDYCLNCEGIWLDTGELELLLESNEETQNLLNSLTTNIQTKEKSHKCPICNKKMKKVSFSKDQEIIIDKCISNHGIWLDKDELRDILNLGRSDINNKLLELLNDMLGKE